MPDPIRVLNKRLKAAERYVELGSGNYYNPELDKWNFYIKQLKEILKEIKGK